MLVKSTIFAGILLVALILRRKPANCSVVNILKVLLEHEGTTSCDTYIGASKTHVCASLARGTNNLTRLTGP